MANKLFGEVASNIKSVDFTDSKIETFTTEAFEGCTSLEKIIFGETCSAINEGALDDCASLSQIIFKGETAPTIEHQNITLENVIIEVPEGKEKDYQDALDADNSDATVTAEADILRYTSIDSISQNVWLFDAETGVAAKWSETEVYEIINEEFFARFSWSGEYNGETISGTFDAQIDGNNEYKGNFDNMTGTYVFPGIGKNDELEVYSDKEQSSLMFTIQPYSEISENTEYTDQGYKYSFVNVEKPTYEGIVVLKSNVTSIGDNAFQNDARLTSIKLPQQITSIKYGAFNNCSGLTSITIPNSVTSIGDSAFSSCSGLTSIDLPSSVETIEYYAFADCSGVSSAICRATIPPTLINGKDKIWFSGLQTDTCQVPANSVSAYEVDADWSSQFAGGFVAIQ